MRVAIVHDVVDGPEARDAPDVRDVLDQVAVVAEALHALGHVTWTLACGLDLARLRHELSRQRPDLVFNLVESLAGEGRLIGVVPGLLDALGIPYTGAGAEALVLSSHKLLGKQVLRAAEVPTPSCAGTWPRRQPGVPEGFVEAPRPEARYLVKSVWEHASVGMDEHRPLLVAGHPDAIRRGLGERAAEMGGACFAEEYVHGRELNLSLLAGPDGPEVLPPAEITFDDYPEERPRVVGYRAKWDADSFEYQHTSRRFLDEGADDGLRETLVALARRCWDAFGLAGWARVDFRVDASGRPFVLEVNTNLCLSPDAGFAAAVARAGLAFEEAVARIIADADADADERG